MASKNKMRKAHNSYCSDALKWGKMRRLKRTMFFDSTQRRHINDFIHPKPYIPSYLVEYSYGYQWSDDWEEGYYDFFIPKKEHFRCNEEDIEEYVKRRVLRYIDKEIDGAEYTNLEINIKSYDRQY